MKMKTKKGVLLSLVVLLVVVLLLGSASILSSKGIFNPVLKFFGITGEPILGAGEYPTSYPIINTVIEKQSTEPGYNISWSLKEDEPSWLPIVLRAKINITTINESGSRFPENNFPTIKPYYHLILGTSPIFKLLNYDLEIQHEPSIVTSLGCKPQCDNKIGTYPLPQNSWIEPCYGTSLKNITGSCPAGYPLDYFNTPIATYFTISPPTCCYKGTEDEGWYNVTDCSSLEILYPTCTAVNCLPYRLGNVTQCELGEYSVFYKMKSKDFSIFEQELKKPGEGASQNTSINWFVAMDFIEGSPDTSGDMLDEFSQVDYVSKWDSSEQKYFGSAYGLTQGSPVLIGSFNIEKGKPYFSSLNRLENGAVPILSYAGVVPSPRTFSLNLGTNLISLPLNTTLNTTQDICDAIGMTPDESSVFIWNPETQNANPPYICGVSSQDISGGRAYMIIDQNLATSNWQQI